ncbi:MAG TPA: hypothetical protein VMW93_09465 [bacterium]|nr:hypothetical protein [bacterium]
MENLFDVLDIFTYGVAILGGLLAILWIYNSTIKERRGILRRARRTHDRALKRTVNTGILLQRLGFSAAAVATGIAILWFGRGYYGKYHVHIASAYFVVAVVLIAAGALAGLLFYLFREKE